MPDSYIRSTDGSVMIEFSKGMFVSSHMAERFSLLSSDQIQSVLKRHRPLRVAA